MVEFCQLFELWPNTIMILFLTYKQKSLACFSWSDQPHLRTVFYFCWKSPVRITRHMLPRLSLIVAAIKSQPTRQSTPAV